MVWSSRLSRIRSLSSPSTIPPEDLAIVTCYFNPCGYQTRRYNFEIFRRQILELGLPLFVIEGVFSGTPESDYLPEEWVNLRVAHGDVLWQKERLLNLMIQRLPEQYSKVAWLDADLIFEEPQWAWKVSRSLDEFVIVQLFEEIVRLEKSPASLNERPLFVDEGHCQYPGKTWTSFGRKILEDPQALLLGDFDYHGHSGFAWAARREVVDPAYRARHKNSFDLNKSGAPISEQGRESIAGSEPSDSGLYDACVTGSGDHVMAHAWAGDFDSPCVHRIFGLNKQHRRHFLTWAHGVYKLVRAQMGYVPGRVLHLWHGDMLDRRYVLRNRELATMGFDPTLDLKVGPDGAWLWTDRLPGIKRWALRYFESRNEDGARSTDHGTQPRLDRK